jgi:hypothetical protein
MLKVEKLHIEYLLAKKTSLLLLLCSFPTLFVWVCIVSIHCHCLFLFSTCSFFALLFAFPTFFFNVNIFLQQSICIMFIYHVVEFALSCCLLLFSCFLLVHFPCYCLGFQCFVSLNIFLQLFICFLSTDIRL